MAKRKAKFRSAPNPRDIMIVDLRTKGYTYDAIAAELFKAGYTKTVVSRVRISHYIRKLAPHLSGCVKHKLRLDKLTRVKDLNNAD